MLYDQITCKLTNRQTHKLTNEAVTNSTGPDDRTTKCVIVKFFDDRFSFLLQFFVLYADVYDGSFSGDRRITVLPEFRVF